MRGVSISKEGSAATYLKDIFRMIDNVQIEYNWLISGHECYPQNMLYVEILSQEYCVITGEKLTKMIENEDFQWIWGNFCGFPKSISEAEILRHPLPEYYIYSSLWENGATTQHPLSEIEIIADDGRDTFIVSKHDNIIEKILNRKFNNIDFNIYEIE